MKNALITLIVLILIAGGVYYFFIKDSGFFVSKETREVVREEISQDTEEETETKPTTLIGTSVEGRKITAYHYRSAEALTQAGGTGDTELLFVGGIHGGYEWNTVLVAYELMDYLEENPNVIPENVQVTVIPILNPDGLNKTIGIAGRFTKADVTLSLEETIPGRFNGNNVDLNRNFDCDWQSTGKWQNRDVDGGSEPFSEPESKALRDYVKSRNPTAVVVWYSAADGVFASSCHNGVLSETRTITNIYADASGYPAFEEFNFYEITGDAVNWLAKEGIPAISVLLTTHEDVEWDKNRAGVEALLEYYAR